MIGRFIISAAGIACTFITMGFTRPVTLSSNMGETLTQTAPGTYLMKVLPIEHGVTENGYMAVVQDNDIILECMGGTTNYAFIKYDGYKASCKFKPKKSNQDSDITAFACTLMPCANDYKPEKPNDERVVTDGVNYETTFTAPRGVISDYRGGSQLELPDGRVYNIPYQTPGEYVDIRIENNNFKGGTRLFYKPGDY